MTTSATRTGHVSGAVEGEFHLTDLDSGQQVVAGPKDVLFFPEGSRIRFETPDRALSLYTGHRSFAP
jgi:ethanolamine utilization protein EutQ